MQVITAPLVLVLGFLERARARTLRSSLLAALAVVLALHTVGCGPSPAYGPEPTTPVDYASAHAASAAGATEPTEPLSSDELARRQQQEQQQQAQAPAATSERGDDVVIGQAEGEYADTDPSALTEWKPVLQNHGTWVDDTTYGTVWVPSKSEVGDDFQPYVTAGRWTYSDTDSWVWVSDYDWGWVPFHYGRWVLLPGYGWSWIPGRTYAGAWVVWRTGPVGYGYVGWAPMAPSWYWFNGVALGWAFGWYTPHYVYCAYPRVFGPSVVRYVVRDDTPAGAVHAGRTAPYQPAQPGVGGNGRVVAAPGVGGNGRVVAAPGVGGGRVAASPGVGPGAGVRAAAGPRPTDLGMKTDAVPTPPADDKKLARAQAFASPSTARTLGAEPPRAPRPHRIDPDAVVGISGAGGAGQGRPGFSPGPSSPAGVGVGPQRLAPPFSSRVDPVVRAPQVQGVVPRPSPVPAPPYSSPRVDRDAWGSERPRLTDPTPFVAQPTPRPSPSPAPPSFGSAQRAAPLVEHWNRPSTPAPSAPSAPSFGGGSSPFRPGPSFGSSSAGTIRPSAPTFTPSPSSRPSFGATSPSFSRPSAPSFRSSPSVTVPGGASGGGGGFRAAPSVGRGIGGGARGGRR